MSAPTKSTTKPPASRPRSILVVEDDAAAFADIEAALASVGVVTRASNGLEALSLLRQGFIPDAIVTDVVMPKMDGIALCRFVKSHPNTSRIPVLMFSSAVGPKDMVAGIAAGARQYLFKSAGSAALAVKVRESIRP
jgi:CheY-like chemotaxis protein